MNNATGAPSVHGHDILHLLHDAPQPLTRAQLAAEAAVRFGADATFHTCSAGGMSLAQLLSFLIARGKVIEADGRLFVQLSEVCGGEGHDHSH